MTEMMMTARLYRLTEMHARIDEALRREWRRAGSDAMRRLRLQALKWRAKILIERLALRHR